MQEAGLDQGSSQEEVMMAHSEFEIVAKSYKILSDPISKQIYDEFGFAGIDAYESIMLKIASEEDSGAMEDSDDSGAEEFSGGMSRGIQDDEEDDYDIFYFEHEDATGAPVRRRRVHIPKSSGKRRRW